MNVQYASIPERIILVKSTSDIRYDFFFSFDGILIKPFYSCF